VDLPVAFCRLTGGNFDCFGTAGGVVSMIGWLLDNWLFVLVAGLGVTSSVFAFVVYAASRAAGQDDNN